LDIAYDAGVSAVAVRRVLWSGRGGGVVLHVMCCGVVGCRGWVRHLATEYSDLSKSLPISSASSVFMRVHESKMAFAQMMIVAPPDTPYAGGCFLFDV
jgi:hypothetical protein